MINPLIKIRKEVDEKKKAKRKQRQELDKMILDRLSKANPNVT